SAFPPIFSTSFRAPSNPSTPRAIRPMRAPSFANLCAVARPTPADAPVITTTSARALISSERHPHLNPRSAPPSRDPDREADAKRLVRVFFIFLPSSWGKHAEGNPTLLRWPKFPRKTL